MPPLRNPLLLGLVAFLCASHPAFAADEIVIGAGPHRGSYYYIGSRLKTELLVRYQQPSEVTTSQGSLANLAALADPADPVSVSFTQTDALNEYLSAHPEFGDTFFVLGSVGRECAFVVGAAKSGAQNVADLLGEAGQISVGAAESGTAVTWRGLTRSIPAFAALEVVHEPTMEAILQLKVGADYTKLRAAVWVQRPAQGSPPMEAVLDDPESYRLLGIQPKPGTSPTLPDGRSVYSFERVVAGGERSTPVSVDTVCTRGLMLAAKAKLDVEQRERLSTVMLEASERIVGKDE